jgi:tetratricopeptide (TPR) repeat protein
MRAFRRFACVVLFVFVFGALFAAACLPLEAQDSISQSFPGGRNRPATYSISGTLHDAANRGSLSGVRVELQGLGGSPVATAFTSRFGDFTFNDISSGNYYLSVAVVGYERIDQQVSVDEAVFGVQIWLHKAKVPPGESSAATVSARELGIPHKAHKLMQKGMSLLGKGDYRGSVTQFERAVKEYPQYYEAYAQMGLAYMDLDDTPNSEQALRKSMELSDERFVEAYLLLGTLYIGQKRFADAEPMARKGTELNDNGWQGHYELAIALYGQNRDTEAENEAQAAQQLQPRVSATYALLADIHLRQHKYPAVLDDVNLYLKLDPNGADADQARHLRDRLQATLQMAQASSRATPVSDRTPAAEGAGEGILESK